MGACRKAQWIRELKDEAPTLLHDARAARERGQRLITLADQAWRLVRNHAHQGHVQRGLFNLCWLRHTLRRILIQCTAMPCDDVCAELWRD